MICFITINIIALITFFFLFRYLWRKKYQRFLFYLSLFLIFDFVIIKSSAGLNNLIDINVSELIYILTGVVIFSYTRETFDLKRISNKQLKLFRKQHEIEYRPYIYCWNDRKNTKIDDKEVHIIYLFKNLGKVPCVLNKKNLLVEINDREVPGNFLKFETDVLFPGCSSDFHLKNYNEAYKNAITQGYANLKIKIFLKYYNELDKKEYFFDRTDAYNLKENFFETINVDYK